MIIHATLVRAALEAAISNCGFGPDGAAYPDELFTNAGKYLGAANYNQMVRHLHDIAGGVRPHGAGDRRPREQRSRPAGEKYMAGAEGIDGAYRMRLFHAIRDLTADAYGG
jgi:4-hydroxybutyryl-CoA dehydratase/vinylacetyl-CoA-Delta-isomerase